MTDKHSVLLQGQSNLHHSRATSHNLIQRLKRLGRALVLAGCFATLTVGGTARATDFTPIPAGDPIYRDLAIVGKAGWLTAPVDSKQSLTRYEVALETAKAIFSVTAHQRSDANWGKTASHPSLRALISLTQALHVELKQLEVDPAATTSMLSSMLRLQFDRTDSPALESAHSALNTSPRPDSLSQDFGLSAAAPIAPGGLSAFAGSTMMMGPGSRLQGMQTHLSQTLRIQATMQYLQLEANDPFGDSALAKRPLTASMARDNNIVPVQLGAGATYDLNRVLHFGANYNKEKAGENLWTGNPTLPLGTDESRVGGSVGVSVFDNLLFSGGVSKVQDTLGTVISNGTRYEGGLDFSAWQNRLILSANISRLVPADAVTLAEPSTAAGFNVGIDVTKRLSLKLLYQGIFGAPDQNHVAGGISIKW